MTAMSLLRDHPAELPNIRLCSQCYLVSSRTFGCDKLKKKGCRLGLLLGQHLFVQKVETSTRAQLSVSSSTDVKIVGFASPAAVLKKLDYGMP